MCYLTGKFAKHSYSFEMCFKLILNFISFSCLIVLARNSRIMLHNSGGNGHSCLVPDFRNTLKFNY